MGQMLQCASTIDGSVFAEREILSREAAFDAEERARASQRRIDHAMAGVAAVGAMYDEIVPEPAHMMGYSVRNGGKIGCFFERASQIAENADVSPADISVGEDKTFKRCIKYAPHGVVFVVALWYCPYLTAINTAAPALIAGNTVILKYDFVNFIGSVGGG